MIPLPLRYLPLFGQDLRATMQRNFNEGRKGLDRGQNLDYDCCLKEGEFFKKTNVREVTLLMLKRAQGIIHFRLKSVRLKNIVDGDQTLGKDG